MNLMKRGSIRITLCDFVLFEVSLRAISVTKKPDEKKGTIEKNNICAILSTLEAAHNKKLSQKLICNHALAN